MYRQNAHTPYGQSWSVLFPGRFTECRGYPEGAEDPCQLPMNPYELGMGKISLGEQWEQATGVQVPSLLLTLSSIEHMPGPPCTSV